MKKNNVILSAVLAVAVIVAVVLGIKLGNAGKTQAKTDETLKATQESLTDMTALQEETAGKLQQTEETLAATSEELENTKTALVDMTALQEETAGTLQQTEETLAATGKELEDTKTALVDMTALQEETAGTLKQTEETLAATGKELEDTKAALADMTALQEETAATLKQTEETLTATGKELEDTKAALADMTALQEETAAELKATQEELTILRNAAEEEASASTPVEENVPAAADEPAWTPYTDGGYTTAILDGWTRTMESADGQLKYFYYGSSFIMVGASPIPESVETNEELIGAYKAIARGYENSGMEIVSQETILINGHDAYLVKGYLQGFPVDMISYYVFGEENIFIFCYARVDDNTERRDQIINLAMLYTTVEQETDVMPIATDADPEAAEEPAAFVVDYPDDAVFEADLNKGMDLTGKTVTFTVTGYKPNSAYGHNLWAGEHLNFVSDEAPGYDVGDQVTVRVTSVETFIGSFIIEYEVVK